MVTFTIINGKVKDQKILFQSKRVQKIKWCILFNFLITGKDRFYFSEDFIWIPRTQSLTMGSAKTQLTMMLNMLMKTVLLLKKWKRSIKCFIKIYISETIH